MLNMEKLKLNPLLLCRTCLGSLESNKYDIFLISHLSKWLSVCTSLNVEENDELPKFLCENCFKKVEDFYEFRKMCVESVQKLYKMIKDFKEYEQSATRSKETELELEIELEMKFDCLESNNQLPTIKEEIFADNLADLASVRKSESPKSKHDKKRKFRKKSAIKKPIIKKEDNQRRRSSRNKVKLKDEDINEDGLEEKNQLPVNSVTTGDEIDFKKNETNSSIEDDNYRDDANDNTTYNPSSDEDNENDNKKKNSKTKKKSNQNEVYTCETCGRRYFKQEKYEACMRKHKGLKPWPCSYPECKRTFKFRSALNTHIKIKHEKEHKIYPCPAEGCDKKYRFKKSMEKHYDVVHQNRKDSLNICDKCGKGYISSAALKVSKFVKKFIY